MRSETKQVFFTLVTTRDMTLAVHELHLDCREKQKLRVRSSVVVLGKLSLHDVPLPLSLPASLLKIPYVYPAAVTVPPDSTTYVCSDFWGC